MRLKTGFESNGRSFSSLSPYFLVFALSGVRGRWLLLAAGEPQPRQCAMVLSADWSVTVTVAVSLSLSSVPAFPAVPTAATGRCTFQRDRGYHDAKLLSGQSRLERHGWRCGIARQPHSWGLVHLPLGPRRCPQHARAPGTVSTAECLPLRCAGCEYECSRACGKKEP